MNGESAFGFFKLTVGIIVISGIAFAVYKIVRAVKDKGATVVDAVSDVARTAADLVNPTSQTNAANLAFNAVTKPIIGDSRSFGSWMYDFLNPEKMYEITKPTPYPNMIQPVEKDVITPADLGDSEQGAAFRAKWAETSGGAVTGILR